MKSCKKCGDLIIGRNSNARYCSISCQENRRNSGYQKPVHQVKLNKFYNPAYPQL